MPNNIFDVLLEEQIKIFQNSFSNTSKTVFYDETKRNKLIHAGEFGMYRETICQNFLNFFIPQRLKMNTGYIINREDEISTQCDLVIYDFDSSPLVKSSELQRFFLVESVAGIGEIKSVLKRTDLKNALNKLAKNKMLRSSIKENNCCIHRVPGISLDINKNPFDQILTFLICEKIEIPLEELCTEIDQMYDQDIPYSYRHNMILSLKDGLILYETNDNIPIVYPSVGTRNHLNYIIKYNPSNPYFHIKAFANYLFQAITNVTIFFPDICFYLNGVNLVEKI